MYVYYKMKYDTLNISLLCLMILCLMIIYNAYKNKEGFEHKYKNSWAISNQITYFRNKYNQNTKLAETKFNQTFIEPVNKKINYYINKYL